MLVEKPGGPQEDGGRVTGPSKSTLKIRGSLSAEGGGLYTPDDGPGWGEVGMTGVPSLLWTGPLDGAGDGACAGATVPNLLCTDPRGVAVVLAGRGERSLAAWAGERPLVRLRRGCGVGDGAR